MKAFAGQPWLLLLHANTALSSIFAESSSRFEEEAVAVKPTLSLEWQEDEIRKYPSEPLSFPQPTLPLGYSNPTFLTRTSNPQELQHQPPLDVLAFEVDRTPTTPPPASNGVFTPGGVLSLEDVPTSKSDRNTCDLACSNESTSICDLSAFGGLTPDAQLTPNHNDFARKRKGNESVSTAESHLVLARKLMKVPMDKKEGVLYVDHPEELPGSTQSNQYSKGRKAGVDITNIRLLLVDTVLTLSDVKIQIENYGLFNEMMEKRVSELQEWNGQKEGTAMNDARARVRVLKFWKSVMIIIHASLLNGQMDKEITQGDVKNVLEFMKDLWEKMDKNETIVTSRLYTYLPKMPNLLDPDDIETHKEGHKGKILWYEASEEIVEYWTEKNMEPLCGSSSIDTNCEYDKFNIRKTFNFIIADKTTKRFRKTRQGANFI
ncbi:hypothetical protein MJO28_015468 [Puccinia striiformis f. sp. tritici]|nr:hypothetical protein Pst134EA_028231 [Puccinia striiformis f. sp. tritici]KAH9448942.1 hypothetical protein Pst134EA_028231 [Puccinia striiformis f. sp. tritici]KAI7937864.1 hypothetical protein MJO29_015179 [Puccinia striiformis f. sp. tritici]KAI7938548.1 hypothetical protein MJO28_015468 [Puccinia striiformis f. sp. tritici]KNF02684.1 hypothetical protein PSTG_03970 [Puccinia striiformis f. sp. tritici PST-78]